MKPTTNSVGQNGRRRATSQPISGRSPNAARTIPQPSSCGRPRETHPWLTSILATNSSTSSGFPYLPSSNTTGTISARIGRFAEILAPGYQLAEKFGKPIMVAELGYEGDQDYVTRWAETVAKPDPQFPKLSAIVYFNDREVYAWPDNYGFPNWRVNSMATMHN